MIESLPFSLKSPIYEVLRNLRLHLPGELQNIPKLGFELIKREDIYKNKCLANKEIDKSPIYL